MYSPTMLESIKRLEASRGFRMKQTLPALSPQEKQATLEKYHPDYKKGMMRKLVVGPNRGGETPNEVADLLESYSRLDPEKFDLSRIDHDTDVLIIGAGGAGSSAALIAAEAGAKVMMVTKLRFGEANTMMAQGGIQAADKENDSPALHYLDVIGGGGFHNKPELVRALVLDAPIAIKWLEEMGMMFDKETDGSMATIHGGGTCRKRMHSARDYSGGEI
ncbi:MAG: FAD-binding protein, partial [Candidatus Aureabacteria bacterium]|nr:FAD-binding protein [Candidatus Auribacterota bacterium]